MFSLHPRLKEDTCLVTDMALSRLLLMNDQNFPWLIMVPRRPDIQEIIDLTAEDRSVLMDEICLVSELMRKSFKPDKINVASLGNMVAQLHIHVVARYRDDPAWPNPVWGTPAVAYDDKTRKEVLDKLGRLENQWMIPG